MVRSKKMNFRGDKSLSRGCYIGFVFSDSIGICHTNLKNYKRGSLGFEVIQWLKIIVTLLMGSKWL